MENVRRMIRLLALVFAGVTMTVTAAEGQNAATAAKSAEPISEARSASCLLKIVTEPSILSLSSGAIDYLFQSSGVRDRAANDVLGLTPEQASGGAILATKVLEQAEIAEPLNERRTLVRLEVVLPEGVKPAAKEFMTAVIANFQKAVEEACQSEMNRLDHQTQVTEREVRGADLELESIQHDLLSFSQQDLSSQGLRTTVAGIMSQLQSLQLEKASKEAYRQAIRERISEIRDETEKSLHEDAIAGELQEIIQRRAVELKNVQGMVDAGRAASTELDAVQDKLATARIDLARRREELGKTGSASSLGQLTGELATLTLEAVQGDAKTSQLEQQLKETQKLLAQAPEYERMMLRLDVAKKNLQEAMTVHNRTKQRARMFHAPSVSVIGG